MEKKKLLSDALWYFVFSTTVGFSFTSILILYDSTNHIDWISLELYSQEKMIGPIKFNYDNFIENLLISYKQFIDGKNAVSNHNYKISNNQTHWILRIRDGKIFRRLPQNLKDVQPQKLLPQKNLKTTIAFLAATTICVMGAARLAKDLKYGLGNLKDLKKFSPEDIAEFGKILKTFCELTNTNKLDILYKEDVWNSFIDFLSWNYSSNPVTKLEYIF